MPTTLTDEEIKMILNRDPELEAQRLFYRASPSEHQSFLWERKYEISFPAPTNPDDVKKAVELGMITFESLVDQKYYWGISRDCRVAKWDKNH